jgi:hypothetical protein
MDAITKASPCLYSIIPIKIWLKLNISLTSLFVDYKISYLDSYYVPSDHNLFNDPKVFSSKLSLPFNNVYIQLHFEMLQKTHKI